MNLSIIIVNWNSVTHLRKCIVSILSNTKGLDFEVVVVDNASYDGCGEMLNAEFRTVKFIQSARNLGFAGANNLGFAHATGDNLLFLNPDTEVVGPAINIMHSHLLSIPDAGAIGCRLLNSDLSLQSTCVQPFPTILNQLVDFEFLQGRFPSLKLWGIKPLYFDPGRPVPVEVVPGACLMIRRDVFVRVGGFSADYFMYTEDIDLCYKITRAGYRVYYTGDAQVVHHGGGSTSSVGEESFNDILMRESISRFLAKYRGHVYARLYKGTMGVSAIGRVGALLIFSPFALAKGSMGSVKRALFKWMGLLRWSIGFEPWVKRPVPYVDALAGTPAP